MRTRVPARLGEESALDAERKATNPATASARAKALMHGGIGSRSRDQRPSFGVTQPSDLGIKYVAPSAADQRTENDRVAFGFESDKY